MLLLNASVSLLVFYLLELYEKTYQSLLLSWINFHIESFDRRNSENINLAGIPLRTNNIILPPLLLRSRLIGLLKRLILNWRWGNHSSSLISEIIKRSTFPLTEICFEMSFYSRVQLWVFFNVPYEEGLKYYNLFMHQLILIYFPRFLKEILVNCFLKSIKNLR